MPVAFLVCACGRIGFGDLTVTDAATDGTSADSRDAPGDGSTVDAPPSLCGGGAFNMCDGFETATLDPRWIVDVLQGSVTVDTTRVYRGATALRMHVNAIGSVGASPGALVRTYDGLPIVGPTYGRVFAFIPGGNPTVFTQYVNFANDAGLGASMGEENRAVIDNNYAVAPVDYRTSATQFPRDRWVCIRYEVPPTGALRVFLDDVEVTDIAAPVTAHPAPTHVYIGVDFPATVTNQPALDAWFDEAVLDDAPVTCAD